MLSFFDKFHAFTALPNTFLQAQESKYIENTMQISRNESITSAEGPADYFTGKVRVEMLFQLKEPACTSTAIATFDPGARTAWHTHPPGQRPIINHLAMQEALDGSAVIWMEKVSDEQYNQSLSNN